MSTVSSHTASESSWHTDISQKGKREPSLLCGVFQSPHTKAVSSEAEGQSVLLLLRATHRAAGPFQRATHCAGHIAGKSQALRPPLFPVPSLPITEPRSQAAAHSFLQALPGLVSWGARNLGA